MSRGLTLGNVTTVPVMALRALSFMKISTATVGDALRGAANREALRIDAFRQVRFAEITKKALYRPGLSHAGVDLVIEPSRAHTTDRMRAPR